MRKHVTAACAAVALMGAAPAFAQGDGGPDPNNVRIRMGPLMMNPTISLTNIGIDHNVFNDPIERIPKEDFNVTVTPTADFWLRVGPTWVSASLIGSINWYQKYASERATTNEYKLGWNVPGSLLSFRIGWDYLNTRDRPGFEIDTRASRREITYTGSFDIHAMSKTFIGMSGTRSEPRFASDATYDGVNLDIALSRVTTTVGVNLRRDLTPLTSLTLSGSRTMDRFEFSPERDSDATTVQGSLSFQPAALLRGGASLGYTNFQPADPNLPAYQGLVTSVDLTYVLLGATRFSGQISRGVQYSYDTAQPYYVQTTFGGSIAQQIFGPYDVMVHISKSNLAYRDREGIAVAAPNRVDDVLSYGIGVGFHMGKDLRLSFNVDNVGRDSQLLDHNYSNYKFGSSLTYGF